MLCGGLMKKVDGKIKNSIKYRQNAEIEIRKIMEYDPYISLGALEERSGYSRQTIASAYLRIRKSPEWKKWRKNYANDITICSAQRL